MPIEQRSGVTWQASAMTRWATMLDGRLRFADNKSGYTSSMAYWMENTEEERVWKEATVMWSRYRPRTSSKTRRKTTIKSGKLGVHTLEPGTSEYRYHYLYTKLLGGNTSQNVHANALLANWLETEFANMDRTLRTVIKFLPCSNHSFIVISNHEIITYGAEEIKWCH